MPVASHKDVMSKQTVEQQPERYAARFAAEKAALRRHYCNAFGFSRSCALKRCRKARSCGGDAEVCLKRRAREIARDEQWQARRHILAATPADAGPAERNARELLPGALV
jgi:hypothetical protein